MAAYIRTPRCGPTNPTTPRDADVSSGLIALAFVGQVVELATMFVFGLLILAPLLFLGLVAFERSLQSGIENAIYARRINRLRRFYFRLGPELEDYLLKPIESDDVAEVMEQEGISSRPLWQPFVTTSGMIGVVNSFLVGVFVGFVAGVTGGRLALAVPVGDWLWPYRWALRSLLWRSSPTFVVRGEPGDCFGRITPRRSARV
jgi:hypothetical protein